MSTDPYSAPERELLRDVAALVLVVVGLIGLIAVVAHYQGAWGVLAVLSAAALATGLVLGYRR